MDVVVCGFDVDGVMYVFNYDIFEDVESYIYCIGWIGCVGGLGFVIMFVVVKDEKYLEEIEKMFGVLI